MLLPTHVVLWGAGLAGLLASKRLAPYRLFGVAFVLLFLGFMLGGRATAGFLAPAYPVLFAAGAAVLDPWLSARRWGYPVMGAVTTVTGAVAAPLALPLFRVAKYEAYAQALHVAPADGQIPRHFADMFGWPELTRAVASVVDALPDDERRDVVVLASNAGEAGALEIFGSLVGLPVTISGHDQFWLWGTAAGSGRVVVAVGGEEATLRTRFRQVDVATVFGHSLATPSEAHVRIFVCRESVEPLDVMWPEFKVYD